MAILPVDRVRIIAKRKDRKKILEFLQHESVIDVKDTSYEQDQVFKNEDTATEVTTFNKNSEICEDALRILNYYAPEKSSLFSSLEGRKTIDASVFNEETTKHDELMKVAYKIQSLNKQIEENKAGIPRIENNRTALEPWMGLDIPIDFKGTKKTRAFIGILPGKETVESVQTRISELCPQITGVDVEIVNAMASQTCLYVLCLKKDAGEVEAALRTMNFARPVKSEIVPAEMMDALSIEEKTLMEEIKEDEEKIKALAPKREALKLMSDYYKMRSDKYEVIHELGQSERVFILEGFIVQKDEKDLEEKLNENFELSLEFIKPAEDEDVPVKLKNNAFAAPLESVVESFSLPGKGDIDPSFISALFYYILFGFMFSDAGYGLILTIACGTLLLRFKNMEPGTKKFFGLFLGCGIGTTIMGVLFGSFFADTIPVVARTFFGKEITLWHWMDPNSDPMGVLRLAFAVGIIHIFVGLGAKAYMNIKAHDVWSAICDTVFWWFLIGGLVAILLSSATACSMFGMSKAALPVAAGEIAKYVAIIGAVGIVLTGGRDSKNWGVRIGRGLYSLYGVSSYLGDILSYSRLLALGLATGMIAQVFNMMGAMAGGGIVGAIFFIIIFVIGHTLNFGINVLGAYVHTNRLTYVEFFGKFYEGEGKAFKPFTMNTKYLKVKNGETIKAKKESAK